MPKQHLHHPHASTPAADATTPGGSGSGSAQLTLFVGVAAEGDLFDTALCALVESMGYPAGILRLEDSTPSPTTLPHRRRTVVLVRSAQRLAQIREHPQLRDAMLVGVGIRASDPRGIDITDTGHASAELAMFLVEVADRVAYRAERVRLTERERQILTTYSLGATMPETARMHRIAESTVREHYRRVTQRYADAGRPIGNKAQLLLRLMADGWVQPREILYAAG